ncbi:MAG: hypothetical protein LBQ52_08355 [Helicobacteraceae bacterium]|jgi:hypothetical protein|nr:hypothetical protein [Helicobacteraceae bacterium]
MRYAFVWLFIAIYLVAANVYQVPLENGAWRLIGINGFVQKSPLGFESGGDWTTIKDYNDDDGNFTRDRLSDGAINSSINHDQGDEVLSTIGLKILKNDSGLITAAINYEILNKNANKSMLGMFVASAGEGRKADLEIRFQEDYKGKTFYIKFNDNGLVMQGVFDPKYTQGAPATLEAKKDSATEVSRILDLIDANLSDNNLSAFDYFSVSCHSLYCVNNSIITGGRQKLLDGSLIAYSWNQASQTWAIFNSKSQNNDFDHFEAGKAYWVRIDAPNNANAGLILAASDLTKEVYSNKLNSGWNMLSFNDSFLRHTPSAVFAPSANLVGLQVRDNFAKNIVKINVSSAADAAKEFNRNIYELNQKGENGWKIRAYPAKNASGGDGIVLISDEDFGVTANGLKTVANQELLSGAIETPIFNMTRVDEHILALRANEALFGANALNQKNAAIQIGFAGDNIMSAIDLSGATNYEAVLRAINSALATNSLTKSGAVLIDEDFSDEYKTVLVSANKRLYARDTTFLRLFDYDDALSGEEFLLRGVSDVFIAYNSDIASEINGYTSSTGIIAYKVSPNRILLSSIATRDFELKELGKRSQFTDRYLYEESNQTAKGAIDEVYSHTALSSAAIDENGTPYKAAVLTDDLSFTAQFSADFPIDGALYNLQRAAGDSSAPDIIVSGVTRDDKTILWRQADLTVPVDSQRNALSRFNLYKLHKDRGYWVYMRQSGAQSAVTSGAKELNSKITRRYSNIFDSNGSNAIAKTRNNISLDISIDANGFDAITQNPIEMPENVFLHIDGRSAPLLKNGASHNYFAELNDRDLEALSEKPFNAPQTGLGLYLTSGLGASVLDERLTFDNRKPRPIEYAFDTKESGGNRSGLIIDRKEAAKIYIYEGNLSDNGNSAELIYEGAQERLNILSLYEINYDHHKPFYDLRIIGEAPNGLQSDSRRLFYAPLYKGTHLLSVNAITDGTHENVTPIAFDLDGQNYKAWVDNYGAPTNSGVQLSLSDNEYNATDSNTTAIVYQSKNLSFPISGTPISSDLDLDGVTVGRIVYTLSQQGDLFYFYHKERDRLAYGYFNDTNGTINLTPIDSNQTIVDPRRVTANEEEPVDPDQEAPIDLDHEIEETVVSEEEPSDPDDPDQEESSDSNEE